jgi:hypothetical protein
MIAAITTKGEATHAREAAWSAEGEQAGCIELRVLEFQAGGTGRQPALGMENREPEPSNIGLGPLIQGPWPICTVSAHLNTVQVLSLAAGVRLLCLILAQLAGTDDVVAAAVAW